VLILRSLKSEIPWFPHKFRFRTVRSGVEIQQQQQQQQQQQLNDDDDNNNNNNNNNLCSFLTMLEVTYRLTPVFHGSSSSSFDIVIPL
jgi:hypothetical protein